MYIGIEQKPEAGVTISTSGKWANADESETYDQHTNLTRQYWIKRQKNIK
jgi:hypothetical protein